VQQKLHPELCAIHPDQPFDFGELAYLLPRDPVLRRGSTNGCIWRSRPGRWRATAKWLN